ncbi:MAG: hypothetical protein MUF15_19580 [Acidobacteria bacterium]|jgi:hypothetical protein|nr:hypothetical protein [Acidobacteriota bacterium]
MIEKIWIITGLFIFIIGIVYFTGCKTLDDCNCGGNQPVSFANDIQVIFTNHCSISGCHNSASARAQLVLDEGQAYANLVNVTSTREPNYKRVFPSDAYHSYIVIKLEGRQMVGSRMPLTGSITDTQLKKIKIWINDGAENN